MNPRIVPVEPSAATGHTKELLDAVKTKLGVTPNLMKTLARSAAALEGYLGLSTALSKGHLSVKMREQIALVVSQQNGCEYCLAAHTYLGKHAGLDSEQVMAARKGKSENPKTNAILKLSEQIVESRGNVKDADLEAVRSFGVADEEIVEVIVNVALNILTNYLNNLSKTAVDFPAVSVEC